jgi:hypothetical protein
MKVLAGLRNSRVLSYPPSGSTKFRHPMRTRWCFRSQASSSGESCPGTRTEHRHHQRRSLTLSARVDSPQGEDRAWASSEEITNTQSEPVGLLEEPSAIHRRWAMSQDEGRAKAPSGEISWTHRNLLDSSMSQDEVERRHQKRSTEDQLNLVGTCATLLRAKGHTRSEAI